MIIISILILIAVVLGVALYFQIKANHAQAEEGQKLLEDYQKRVDEQQKLLEDYRTLEKNFESVGEGYDQALLMYDKMEENTRTLEEANKKLAEHNDKLLATNSRIGELSRKTSEFMSQVSNGLQKELEDLGQLSIADDVKSVVKRLAAQVSNLKNLNDFDSETPLEHDDNVTVNDIVSAAVKESAIDSVNYFTFKTEVSEVSQATMLLTNQTEVVRVLSQLLNNAAKFTTDGCVVLSVDADDTTVTFTVEDTGMGIPAEEAEHVFDPFVKLNSYFDGIGIGLTAARNIARRLGGDVKIDTAYTAGARVVFTLPL